MTKTLKMSLVAAVAVAGLTTTSTAGSLESAVKNTSYSGFARLRVNTNHDKDTKDTTSNEQKLVLKFKSKVNDKVTSLVKLVANGGSKSDTLNMNQLNFTVKNGYTATIGKQTAHSPFVANNGDMVVNGITAVMPLSKSFKLAAAYYNNTSAAKKAKIAATTDDNGDVTAEVAGTSGTEGTTNIAAVAIMAKIASASVQLWHLQTNEEKSARQAVLVSAPVGPVKLGLKHAKTDVKDTSVTFVTADAKLAGAKFHLGYVTTGKASGNTTLDKDTDGTLIFGAKTNKVNTMAAEVTGIVASVSKKIGAVKAGLRLVSVSGEKTNADSLDSASETMISLAYPMSKNLKLSAYYATGEKKSSAGIKTEDQQSRLEMKYSF